MMVINSKSVLVNGYMIGSYWQMTNGKFHARAFNGASIIVDKEEEAIDFLELNG